MNADNRDFQMRDMYDVKQMLQSISSTDSLLGKETQQEVKKWTNIAIPGMGRLPGYELLVAVLMDEIVQNMLGQESLVKLPQQCLISMAMETILLTQLNISHATVENSHIYGFYIRDATLGYNQVAMIGYRVYHNHLVVTFTLVGQSIAGSAA